MKRELLPTDFTRPIVHLMTYLAGKQLNLYGGRVELPARYREVIVLCELQELSYADAASVLECAVGTVRSRLHRARALLIDKMRPETKDEPASMA